MDKIVINLPSDDSEGYFDFLEKAAELQNAQTQGFTPEVVRNLRDFCAQFIEATDADDRATKAHRLSKNDFNAIIAAFTGEGGAAVPPQSGELTATP